MQEQSIPPADVTTWRRELGTVRKCSGVVSDVRQCSVRAGGQSTDVNVISLKRIIGTRLTDESDNTLILYLYIRVSVDITNYNC